MKYQKRAVTQEILDELNKSVQRIPRHRRLANSPVCDFCGSSDKLKSQYGATRMTDGTVRDCWRWLACEDCDALIDQNDWPMLEIRMTDSFIKMLPSGTPYGDALQAIRHAQRRFFMEASTEGQLADGQERLKSAQIAGRFIN